MPDKRTKIRLLLIAFGIINVCMLPSCERTDSPVIPALTRDPVYNADGGFIITRSMLDKPYNRITFPGTHNSFAGPNWHDACGNHDINIAEQLHYGIRYIELDVDHQGCASHNGWCKRPLDELLHYIRFYALEHPGQIITVRISDIACRRRYGGCRYITRPYDEWMRFCGWPTGKTCCEAAASPETIYRIVNDLLEGTGLSDLIYNWDGSISDNSDLSKCYVPEPWPTLGEMIDSRKNVMLLHHRDIHDIVDSGYFMGLSFCEYTLPLYKYTYASFQLADLSKLQPVWDPAMCPRQKEGSERLFLLECNSQTYKTCRVGDAPLYTADCPQTHRACNDGRRHYQLARQYEQDFSLLRGERAVTFIAIDYYMSNQFRQGGWHEPISVVDACNRLNFEKFGIEWSESYFSWELQPHEFDPSRKEHVLSVSALREEVDGAISDYKDVEGGLRGHEMKGAIQSSPVYEQRSNSEKGGPTGWLWLPEWAVDDDFYTAWRGRDWGGSLLIDMKAKNTIDEIAIAWKYTYLAPGYRVYAANFDEASAAYALPSIGTGGWTLVAETSARLPNPPQPWDRVSFTAGTWRYLKIELTEYGPEWGSAIFELRVYGPSK